MLHITYKPLTERMLQEPFWLGLLTVFVVMGILGIIWCAKRHVPEKIEKILSEEAERSRHCEYEWNLTSSPTHRLYLTYSRIFMYIPTFLYARPIYKVGRYLYNVQQWRRTYTSGSEQS